MKRIFPNIETAILFVFLIIVMLWGVSRCNKKKAEVSANLLNSESMSYDSLGSPAARSTQATPTTLPQQAAPVVTPTVAAPPQYSTTVTTPPPTTPAQTVQQPTQQTTVPLTSATPPKTPGTLPVTTVPSTTQNAAPAASSGTQTPLYVLQNGLNVRSNPNLKAKSLGKLKLHDQVYFLNEVTEISETVHLADGTEISKPWFKIKTKRGTVGWVHGSGVDFYKRKPNEGL
jgi:cytoskeletal protein RodZ